MGTMLKLDHQVSIRAFFPVWLLIYVIQFLLWYFISGDRWYVLPKRRLGFSTSSVLDLLVVLRGLLMVDRISIFLGNTLYLVAFLYYNVIIFLGYNGTQVKFPELFAISFALG